MWNMVSLEQLCFSWNCLPSFKLHFLTKPCLFILPDAVYSAIAACTRHNFLYNTFILSFLACEVFCLLCHWLMGTWLKCVMYSANTKLSFSVDTQASSFYKLAIPSVFVIFVWQVFTELYTKLMLHRNNRFWHLKKNPQKAFFCCDTSWPHSEHEKLANSNISETYRQLLLLMVYAGIR